MRPVTGSVFKAADGFGIRWSENGKRPQKTGFRTKTEARDYFSETVKPRLKRGGPSAEITFDDFTTVYLDRWGPTVNPRTLRTVREWLGCPLQGGRERIIDGSARKTFGRFTLQELGGAANDIAHWRAGLPSDDKRYKATKAMRQVLAAAVRWGYLTKNPAVDAGANPQPRGEEVKPPSREERDRIMQEMSSADAALVLFVSETGLRTNEWMAVERRDIDRLNPAVAVARRFSRGRATPYPKTQRRRVPLTPLAVDALSMLPARLDTQLLFPAPMGGYMELDNWRLRRWYPALEGAGVSKRGPYQLRHFFATEALAAGVSIFQLSRFMGASVETIERHYGHLARDSEDEVRRLLANRGINRQEETG